MSSTYICTYLQIMMYVPYILCRYWTWLRSFGILMPIQRPETARMKIMMLSNNITEQSYTSTFHISHCSFTVISPGVIFLSSNFMTAKISSTFLINFHQLFWSINLINEINIALESNKLWVDARVFSFRLCFVNVPCSDFCNFS